MGNLHKICKTCHGDGFTSHPFEGCELENYFVKETDYLANKIFAWFKRRQKNNGCVSDRHDDLEDVLIDLEDVNLKDLARSIIAWRKHE